ncbi:MAG: histidinol-phosphatase HisJ family protein [Clostridiales bacterium]|jgi:histidinol-phosphatase (PHP family)|nr:histidinol-phosphatase HisJ family protein [Clostridiales bacterium]
MLDSHTHSEHSADSVMPLDDLISTAVRLGLSYLAVTDHMDRDFLFCKNAKSVRQLDLPAYAAAIDKAKKVYGGKIKLAFGIECGYSKASEIMCRDELKDYDFDVIINSVHSVNDEDIYIESYYKNKTKDEILLPYIRAIDESLDIEMPYDIVGHIGYIARKAPYPFEYADYDGLFDKIFKKIIQKGKCLEINSHVKFAKADFFPGISLIKRYRELGGELITFSSDAHQTFRVAEKYPLIAETAKALGFKYFAAYLSHKPEMYLI